MSDTRTAWHTDDITSLEELRARIHAAFGEPDPDEVLQDLLNSETSRRSSRVMFVEELRRALAEGEAPTVAQPPTSRPSTPAGESSVPLDRVDPNPFQPRTRFTDAELDELGRSIEENGLLQPIVVRSHPNDGSRYQLVAGERRTRAMRRLGWTDAPAIVRVLDDRQLLVMGLVENIQRSNLTVVEEARAFGRFLEMTNSTQTVLGREIGKTQSHISNRLRLLKLPEPILKLIDAGILSHSHARDHILPFAQLSEEDWAIAGAAVATELAKRGTGDELDEDAMLSAVRTALRPMSRPLSHESHDYAVDQKVASHTLPEGLKKRHHRECRCGAPGFPWRTYGGRKSVRCFDRKWWKSALADERRKEKARSDRTAEKMRHEMEAPQELDPPIIWPDRSIPVPRETFDAEVGDSRRKRMLTFGDERIAESQYGHREFQDPDCLDPRLLYWVEPEDEEGPPELWFTGRCGYGRAGFYEAEAERNRRRWEAVRAEGEEDLGRAKAMSPATVVALLAVVDELSQWWLARLPGELGLVDVELGEDGSPNIDLDWQKWVVENPAQAELVASVVLLRAKEGRLRGADLGQVVAEQLARDYAQRLLEIMPAPELKE